MRREEKTKAETKNRVLLCVMCVCVCVMFFLCVSVFFFIICPMDMYNFFVILMMDNLRLT